MAFEILEAVKKHQATLVLTGGKIQLRGRAGLVSQELMDRIRKNKSRLVQVLSAGPDPLPAIHPEHHQQILAATDIFFIKHGPRLEALGWDRENLFSGLDPESAQDFDDMPALPLLLVDGADLAYADTDRLEFHMPGGRRLVWVKPGMWLAGAAAERHLQGSGTQ
ncbi:MAG: hypothetical protein HQL52_19485 [Magnetococcales bacterium]|nr:hypothetical protein [Magnetococcales bacterium]